MAFINSYRRILLMFLLLTVIVGFVATITFRNMKQQTVEQKKAESASERSSLLNLIFDDVVAMDESAAKYLLLNDNKFKQSFYSKKSKLNSLLADFKIIESLDSPGEKIKTQLSSKIDEKVNVLQSVMQDGSPKSKTLSVYQLSAPRIKKLTNEIQLLTNSLVRLSNSQYHAALLKSIQLADKARNEFLLLVTFLFLVLIFFFWLLQKDFKKNLFQEQKLLYSDSLISSLSDPIITIDNENKIVSWNIYAEKLYGYNEKDVIGKDVIELLQPDYLGITLRDVQEFFTENGYWKGEILHLDIKDRPIYVQASVSVLQNNKGKVTGCVAILSDISTRKDAELKLQQITANLEEQVKRQVAEINIIFDRITDAFIALDNNWCYTYVNAKAAELHGKSAEYLMGKNIWNEYPSVKDNDFYHALHRARQTRKPLSLQLYFTDSDQWFEDFIYPSADGISVYYRDITASKKAELELQRTYYKLNNHLENTPLATIEFDKNFIIKKWSDKAEEIFGWNNREIGLPSFDSSKLFQQDDWQSVLTSLNSLMTSGKGGNVFFYRNICKDGKVIYCEWYNSVLLDDEGNCDGFMSMVQDITDKQNAREQLLLEKQLSDSIINSLPGIFYLFNRSGQYIRWNNNFERVTGYDSSEIPLLRPLDVVPDEERDVIKERMALVFEKREASIESLFLTKDGRKIPYYFTGIFIRYENQDCLMGVGIDISEKVKSQVNLIKSEQNFRILIDQASDGIFISDKNGNYVEVNKSACDLTGYSRQELLSMNMLDLLDNSDENNPPISKDDLLKDNIIIYERKMKIKDGAVLIVEISAKALSDGRFQAIVRDITSRKRTEDILRDSEEKRRLIMNAALDAIITINNKGIVTFWNPQAEKIFGWKSHQVIGSVLSEIILPEKLRVSGNESMINYITNHNNQLLNQLTELSALNRIGEEFPIEMTILPIEQKNESFYCLFIRDITERKSAIAEIRQSENKYRLLFDRNPLPMWIVSREGLHFLDVNTAAVDFFGYPKNEFIQMKLDDLIIGLPVQNSDALLHEKFAGIYNPVYQLLKKDGSIAKVHLIKDDINFQEQSAILMLSNDVTEKIEAEERLKKSHTDLRELATHLQNVRESERAHIAREIHDELGQQLTGLKMDMVWLSRKLVTEDELLTNKMNETLNLIDATVRTVRRLATQLRPSILDDLGLISALEWQSEEFHKRSDIICTFKSNVSIIDVSADVATGLFRIYQESLTNVLRHSGAKRVETALLCKDNLVILTIKDDGVGFNYSTIEANRTLGLLGMKERTLMMGGTYEVISKVGEGTKVEVIVPIVNFN